MDKKLIFPERESKNLEFKSELPEFEKLVKTCIAMANGAGGQIIIGIEDGSRKIIGIKDWDRDRLYDEFPNSLYDSVSPTLLAQIYEKRIEDLSVLIIQIPPSPKKPYFMKRDGFPKGVYVRVGTSTRRANQDSIEDLVREGNRLNFDEEFIPEDTAIFSKELIKNFYGTKPSSKKLLSDKTIALSATGKDTYHPTITGILFFTEDPHTYLPEASIICTSFKGNSGREIIQTQELTGPIDKLAEDSLKLISSWIARNYKLHGAHLKGELLIPEKALREAIVNSLIHRKYSIPGAVKISVYEHHLDILSPGCFPGLVDLENLGDGTTFLRNPHIARIAHRMGLVEKLGSGIRLIFDSCEEALIKKPTYHEGNDTVTITFYFEKIQQEKSAIGLTLTSSTKMSLENSIKSEVSPVEVKPIVKKSSDEDLIFALLGKQGTLSIQDIMQALNVSRNTATRKLTPFIKEQKIIREGKGPSVRYRAI